MKPNRPLNLFANYVGTGWTVLIQLLLVPVYMRLLGPEAYGLVGFYMTVQSVLQILDAGVSPALNRELARRTAVGAAMPGTPDMVKTLETIYWMVGLGLALLIAAGSSPLATHWINNKTLPTADVARAIALMGLSFAFQWPISFYTGGLLGLQRQTAASMVNTATATVFGLGVVAPVDPVSQRRRVLPLARPDLGDHRVFPAPPAAHVAGRSGPGGPAPLPPGQPDRACGDFPWA